MKFFQGETKLLVVDKNKAAYLRSNLKNVCIVKTCKQRGGKRGHYMVEETSPVLRLLEKYEAQFKIIEEYPASK